MPENGHGLGGSATLPAVVTVPQRLLSLPIVEVVHAGADVTVLRKRTREPLYERPSSLSTHALSFVEEGEQVVYDDTGARIRVTPGRAGLMRRDLYTITDLLAGETGAFATTVAFFSDAVVRRAVELRGGGSAAERASVLCLLDVAPGADDWVRARSPGGGDGAWAAAVATFLAASLSSPAALLSRPRRSLREFMRAHFDKPLSVEDYAYLTGRSVRSFRRDFAARFGESPKRWLVARRLERARELLRRGEVDSVNGAAAAVGYGSTSHFIARYRERYGETPMGDRAVP